MKTNLLLTYLRVSPLFYFLILHFGVNAQDVVFSENFSTSAGSTFAIANGPIGSSTLWSMNRSGADFGAGIDGGLLVLTNDASGAANQNGWVLASTPTSNFASPYNQTLAANSGLLTWTFNMRQSRSNPSGFGATDYGVAFILAGSSGTTNLSGTGYAITLGNTTANDPIRLVRYNAGIRNFTTLLSSNTNALNDFGSQHISVKVTFNPTNSTWQLFVRNDGTSFQDPANDGLTLQGSVVNSTYVNAALPLLGAYWNASTVANQRATFDAITVRVAKPILFSLTPSSAIAGSVALNISLTGENFTPSSVVRWNGSNRTTTYISPTQLTVAIPSTDLQLPGLFPITVANGLSVSNAQEFDVDPAGEPTLLVSTNSLASFTTISGTASSFLTYTISGENLTANAVVTAPLHFELSSNGGSTYADNLTLIRNGLQLTGQPITLRCRIKASAPSGSYSGSISHTTTGGVTKFVAVTGKVIAMEPTVQATAVTFTNVSSTSMTLNFTPGNGANRMVLVRSGAAVNSAPIDGVSYVAASSFGSGSQLGTGNFVVYRGVASSVTITNLSPTTTYHVAVYEYNGSGGLENYLTTGAAIGNRATLNAPVGWQISTANTVNTIDFDTHVDGVHNETFQGDGFAPTATSGQLSSNAWSVLGFSSGNLAFGATSGEDTDFDRGTSDVPVTEGGIYAYETSPSNYSLGLQSATGDFTPGSVTLRFQNQTGVPVTSLNIGYTVYVYNNQPSSSSLNFSHSANTTTFTDVPGLSVVSPAPVDLQPGWKAYYRVVTLTGLSIASNNYYYLRWTGTTVSGTTTFDGIALDDIVMVVNPTTTFVPFSGTAESFVLQGNARLSGSTTVQNLTFNGGRLDFTNQSLTLSGSVVNTTAQGLRGSSNSTLIVNGAVSSSLSFDQTTPGTTNALANLQVATSGANTVTLSQPVVVQESLLIAENQTLQLGTNALTGALTSITNNGTLQTQNTSALPLPSGKVWGGTGVVHYNAASAPQTVVVGTYQGLTISSTGGAVAAGSFTVNGVLHLPTANPSATVGSLSMGAATLTMGGLGTNTGVGDVTGVVTRNQIIPNVNYTFGHQHTSILFPNIGTLPTSMSLKITIGAAPSWRTGAILREYDFIQTGGSGTKAIIRARYLDSELNGNVENKLVDWAYIVSVPIILEQGRSNYNTQENWIELTNVNVGVFFTPTFGNVLLTLDESEADVLVWNGSVSTSWTTAANWTPNATPSDNTAVIIPNATTTPNDPELNPLVLLGKLTIQAGGILNSPNDAQFTINGAAEAWSNEGVFNPGGGDSRVLFSNPDATISGTTLFNHLTILGTGGLRPVSGTVIEIGGALVNSGNLFSGSTSNTIIYSGTNQVIAQPTGTMFAYNNLIINGTGAVFPSSLNIAGNLQLNQAIDFSGKALVMNGTGTQIIGGTVSPVLSDLTLQNSLGEVQLATSVSITGTLTLTEGLLDIGDYHLTLGAAPVSGTFTTSRMLVTSGLGKVRRTFTGVGSYTFPIGERTNSVQYTPLTVSVTSGTFSSAYVGVSVVDAVHPNNSSISNTLSRYWHLEHSGITNGVLSATTNYDAVDIVGSETGLVSAVLQGTFNQFTNPWEAYSTLEGLQLTVVDVPLENGLPMVITAIQGVPLEVNVSGFGSFCIGSNISLLATVQGGTPPYLYTWSDSLGDATTATPLSTTPGTTIYEVTVTDSNGIQATTTAEVVILPQTVGGTLSNQTICLGSMPADFVLSGSTGTILYWESATDLSFTTPMNYSVTTNTLPGLVVGPLLTTTYFRAVLQDGGCDEVYSTVATVTFSSTTWNGSAWSNGAPDASTSAVFSGNYTSTGDLAACSLLVLEGAIVTVNPTHTFYSTGVVTVEAGGQFVLESNANLVQIDDVVNSGTIVVKRFTSNEVKRLDYNLWSSPVTGQNLLSFSPQTLTNRFYIYNPTTNLYNTVTPSVTNFTAAKGYLIRMPNNSSDTTAAAWLGVFTGVPHNGIYDVPVTPGTYNAIGNPYPSTINANEFIDTNGLVDPLYFWRKTNNATVSSYATYTTAGGTSNGESNSNGGSSIIPNGILQVGQGFIVKATSNNLVFTNDMRVGNTQNQFLRVSYPQTSSTFERHRIWLNMSSPTGPMGQLLVAYMTGATSGVDPAIDGKYIQDSPNYFTSFLQETAYTIQGRGLPFVSTDVVPLVYSSTESGTFSISLTQFDGLFTDSSVGIYIKDNQTGAQHDIRMSPYTFVSASGVFNSRFELVYQNTLSVDHPVFTDDLLVYASDKIITGASATQDLLQVTVYDLSGRLLFMEKQINSRSFSIPLKHVADQMVLVQVATERGVVTKKVLLY